MGEENEPTFRLAEAVQSLAFGVHPYKHEIIGDLADLETINRQDLIEHYHRHYRPGNAVLALAGDFQTENMTERLGELYGRKVEQALQFYTFPVEPEQAAEQRITLTGPGETTYLQDSYRAPSAADPDFLPLAVLDLAC